MSHRVFPRKIKAANVPNLVSTIGLGTAVAWLMGAGPGFAIVSIMLDEMDGTIARLTGQTTKFGAEYDFAIDMVLQGAAAVKIGAPWLLLVTVPLSTSFKASGKRPWFGSFRANMMSYGVLRGVK